VYQCCLRLQQQQPGNQYLKRIIQHFTSVTTQPVHLPFGETLSQREMEVLLLLAEGASNEEIAETLVLTTGTVKWHLHNIFGKLESKNRIQAVKQARALGFLSA
jgi:LuxR family maltose regulon positive regulatory protein